MYSKGDFHIHTTASDGKLTPEELVKLAKVNQLDIIAVTDHDITLGIDRAQQEGLKQNVRVIPAIELSTLHNGESIHLLGYFSGESYKNADFQRFLHDMKEYRISRGKKITENLDKFFNIKIDYNKVYEDAEGVIARPHIAKAIIEAGYDYSWDYIFDNIISKESPAYVPNKEISVPEGIEILKSVNATVILAHPVLIKKTNPVDFMSFDIDGIEAIYALNTLEQTDYFMNMAKKFDKIVTAGSDFHGSDLGDTKHGGIGSVHLKGQHLTSFLNKLGI